METLQITTREREELLPVSGELQRLVREQGWRNGALLVHCPHTTGAVTINEGADPDVVRDIVVNLRRLVPRSGDYRHAEGNSDAHIKASTFGPDQLLIVNNGEIQLGTWQKVFFCEFDGPRTRKLWVQFLPS
ncbi:secondary thiamine-phosphate synthase enzyme [Paucidesulfovibrio gracilis DSM 16080]|uniref:Secondary thiamine-phosphate synthase enzyme n=1 Tax=Paucidesulfovibrio gracilis DSM 16080 TaxID=1121449 RepID=A0A1T4X0Z9_9BACT|nr:secondary thiamine-phosphate synthase enzyme YjbQ [Paucidesulfovibrio gracilis]SKA83262.1 secondary thiamine-phosphate synthase enzyme [Paucidesulfovibrio gracilis DSM 16080]